MMSHIRINPLFFVVIILAGWMGDLESFLITYLALLFHESIHLWFLSKNHIPVRKITLEPFGISILTERKMPENAIIYLSAPIGNLLVAALFLLAKTYFALPVPPQWILANVGLGITNLLPMLPLDGG